MTISESQVFIGTSATRERYERTSIFCIDCVTGRSDTTSNSTDYTVNHAVSGDSNLTIRVRAVGSDTYPEHDFADWFVVGLTATLTNR